MPAELRLEPDTATARAAFWCAAACTVAILFSIAASQILLGLSIVVLAACRERLRIPPVWIPLAAFLGGTLLSIAASGSPAAGFPQVKKIFVYLMLPVVYSAVRQVRQARWLVLAWAGAASAGAIIGVVQFLRKVQAAHRAGETF